MTVFALTKDVNGSVDYGLRFSDTNYKVKILADTAVSITIPDEEDWYKVLFSYESGSKVWVANTATAITPPADSTPTLTAGQLNPTLREVAGGSTIQLITSDTSAEVCICIYTSEVK